VIVVAAQGTLSVTPLPKGAPKTQTGALSQVLPAPGLSITITPQPGGSFCVEVAATDAWVRAEDAADRGSSYALKIPGVNPQVAARFDIFAKRVNLWTDKMQSRIEYERLTQRRREEEAAKEKAAEAALAEATAKLGVSGPLSEAQKLELAQAQIAQWRTTAGFTGTASAHSADKDGRIEWFIDLDDAGRITLHADKRTVHATMAGATVQSVGGELEIGVRDEYWTEDEADLRLFRVLGGVSAEVRRAWKERLEIMRDSMRSSSAVRP